jgi:ribosomal protein L25 (general stress protein Ctc)
MARTREKLKVAPRAEFGSRSSRRLRGEGLVLGVVYGGGSEARAFQVAERDVRTVLAGGQSGAGRGQGAADAPGARQSPAH